MLKQTRQNVLYFLDAKTFVYMLKRDKKDFNPFIIEMRCFLIRSFSQQPPHCRYCRDIGLFVTSSYPYSIVLCVVNFVFRCSQKNDLGSQGLQLLCTYKRSFFLYPNLFNIANVKLTDILLQYYNRLGEIHQQNH